MNFSIASISKYRTELMGYAIIGVMVAHIKTICVFPESIWNSLLGILCHSIFTGGFIFLSGLGLYSSMSHNSNPKDFYLKRVKRLLLPYWIISTPYFVFTDLYLARDIVDFLGHFSTLSFWINGNYSGMWYISMSIFLYLIYPLIHKTVYINKSNVLFKHIALVLLIGVLVFSIRLLFATYYHLISVGIDNLFLFILGAFVMYLITHYNGVKSLILKILIGGGIALIISLLATRNIWSVINFISIVVVACIFANIPKRFNFINVTFKWFGKYSLELYIIHLLTYYFLNSIDSSFSEGYHIVFGVAFALVICKPVHLLIDNITRLNK